MESAYALIKNNFLTSVLVMFGVVLVIGGGVWWWKSQVPVEIEILDGSAQVLGDKAQMIQIDVQGEIVNPGVYQLPMDSRIKDTIAAAGGLSANADRIWVARYVNLAQKVVDGTKIYIPSEKSAGITNDQLPMTNDSASGGFVNINSATLAELDALSGVGEVRAQAIISGRPYGDIQELVTKKILPQSVFDKVKGQISVF